jgi:hypothetical protein
MGLMKEKIGYELSLGKSGMAIFGKTIDKSFQTFNELQSLVEEIFFKTNDVFDEFIPNIIHIPW